MFTFPDVINVAVMLIEALLPAITMAGGLVVGGWILLRFFDWLRGVLNA